MSILHAPYLTYNIKKIIFSLSDSSILNKIYCDFRKRPLYKNTNNMLFMKNLFTVL